MAKYEYKFVRISKEYGFKVKTGDAFNQCKQAIEQEAEQGWRLVQVVTPFKDNASSYEPYCYEIIFEREV